MSKRTYVPLTGQDAVDAMSQVMDLTWQDGSPVRLGDFGHRMRISGVYFQGEGNHVIMVLPTAKPKILDDVPATAPVRYPDYETWSSIILATDDPVIFELGEASKVKAIHRKVQHQISGGAQWRVWEKAGFRCLYCGRHGGGSCPLTVDHFVPLARGGANDQSNYIAACRRCAKDKGDRDPQEWCQANGYDYFGLTRFLEGTAPVSFIAHLEEMDNE